MNGALWLHLILVSAAAAGFYVYARSFPLSGEDGAFNYMSLLQRLEDAPISLSFGFKLIEGLGQPNPFLTIMFDPFSWPLLLVRYFAEAAQNYLVVFQLTMAARVIVCWFGTYVLASAAFPGAPVVAVTASYLNVFLSFFLAMNFGGTQNYSGIPNATLAALLPLLLGVYVRGVLLKKSLLSVHGLLTFALLFFSILCYPIGSVLDIAVVLGVAVAMVLFGGFSLRRVAIIYLLGLVILTLVILFLPGLSPYASWRAVADVSSRTVFSEELRTFFGGYSPPTFWYAPPLASRLIAFFGVSGLLVVDRVPPIARVLLATLAIIVGGIQIATFVSSTGVLGDFVRPLPPLARIETFIPTLYAFSAAVALFHAGQLLTSRRRSQLLIWVPAAIVVMVSAIYMFWGVYGILGSQDLTRSLGTDMLTMVAVTLLISALIYKAAPRLVWRCVPISLLWPITQVKPRELARRVTCYVFVGAIAGVTIQIWATKPFFISGYLTRDLICTSITFSGCRDDNYGRGINAGANPVIGFLQTRLRSSDVFSGRAEYMSPHNIAEPNSTDFIAERNRNFLDGGNGMLLASLSFNGISIPSTYEQSYDYLYYLFWTRYLTQNTHIRFTPNWIGLYQFLPKPLALAGVRYVVSRQAGKPQLGGTPIVFRWKDYVVAELPDPNLRGYGVTAIRSGRSIADQLVIMRGSDFDPRRDAVLSDDDRQRLPDAALRPVVESEIHTQREVVHLTARSSGGASVIVLPFRFSNCWSARWNGAPGTLLRADVALLAIYFDHDIDAEFEWTGGYGTRSRCLRADATLINEAQTAAAQIPY